MFLMCWHNYSVSVCSAVPRFRHPGQFSQLRNSTSTVIYSIAKYTKPVSQCMTGCEECVKMSENCGVKLRKFSNSNQVDAKIET